MRSSHRTNLAAGTILAALLALVVWCAAPLVADSAKPPAKKQTAPKTAAPSRAVPSIRAERRTRSMQGSSEQEGFEKRASAVGRQADQMTMARRPPREQRMRRAQSFDGDLRTLPQTHGPWPRERPEREGPRPNPILVIPDSPVPDTDPGASASAIAALSASAPAPTVSFDGLDRANWGAGFPPDTNGDVGPDVYIQTINTSIGIFRKSDGFRLAAFTFNTFMSQGQFGNLCDTNNFGDPVVLYDSFEDRWVITDFAFKLDASGNVVNPPGSFQCFAASKTGDPLAGGWNFYSINTTGGLGDYPKFGIWPDGIYMSANMFDYAAGGSFQNPRVYALNKAQLYSGAPTVQVLSFDAPSADFTLLPSNARLQAGTPPPGTPNYFLSTWQFTNAVGVYSFHVDWNSVSLSTFTGPALSIASSSWPNMSVANAPSLGGNSLDVLQIRAMMQNQYSNLGGAESLWATHTVRRANVTGFAAPRWYQLNVTGGTVAPNMAQAATWDPDAANVIHRFMPSLAVDHAGNMALGYSTSSSTTKPAIKYAGRLATDPLNTFSQTEQQLIQGDGTQTNNCGGAACSRWGDYSAMTLDPDGCTFWYTNEYYAADGSNYQTRIGSFAFPACTPVTTGTLQGIVRTGTTPLAGATVALGSRTTTTDASGTYAFTGLSEGTYPSATASMPGYQSQTFTSIVVNGAATTTRDFTLDPGTSSACVTDTSQSDFQAGVATGCDLTASPGSVILVNTPVLDQRQTNSSGSGLGITTTQWLGQTFVPAVTGALVRVEASLFCAGCSGANPPIIVEIRTTSGGLPTGTVLASTTIAGFSSGASAFYPATFAAPAALTSGTTYAYTLRIDTARTGTYAGIFSTTAAAYPNGDRVLSQTSGATWIIPTSSGTARDLAFRTFMSTGFAASGTFISSAKDANPAQGATATWGAISWNASVPAGTTLQFQAAASNNPAGPFSFVGPDGTSATSFGNGASLAQFNGNRYLKYWAVLGTSSGGATPTIDDVTICFTNVQAATALSIGAASGPFGGTTTLSATLTTGGTGLVGKPVSFTLNGTGVGSAVTNGVGVATLSNVSLAGIDAGTYPGGVAAAFAGELGYVSSTASNDLTVSQLPQAIDFAPLADRVATDPPFTVSATGGASGNPVTFSTDSTACSVSGNTVTLNAAGDCAIKADQAGSTNYSAAPQVTRSFTVSAASQTITFPAIASFTWSGGSATLTATASSGLAVTYTVLSGPCAVAGSTLTATQAGSCLIAANQAGNAKYGPAPQVTATAQVNRAPQTILFGALAGRTYGDADVPLIASASSGLPVSFAAAGQCAIAGSAVHITGSGSCAITASQSGDANYLPAADVMRSFTIAKASLIVKADNKVKLLNAVNPPLTGTVTGVVGADAITATYATTALLGSPVGLYPIVPTIVDPLGRLGNYSVQVLNGALAVIYAPSGNCYGEPGHQILPPINPNGTSVFKPRSNIDVQFRVCDARGISIGTPGVVASFKLIRIVRGGVTTNVSLDPSSERHDRHERGFRFDDDRDDREWVFHLNTKDLAPDATYGYRIVLNDGSTIEFQFTLRKKNDGDRDDDRDRGGDRDR